MNVYSTKQEKSWKKKYEVTLLKKTKAITIK